MNHRRVPATGGPGFVGGHLVDGLISDECEFIVLDDSSMGRKEKIKHHLGNGNVVFVQGDVRDKRAVNEAVGEADAVFHLAAVTNVPYSIRNMGTMREVDMKGTMNVLGACLRDDVERFIHVSTCAVCCEAKYYRKARRGDMRDIYADIRETRDALGMSRRSPSKMDYQLL